MVDLNALGLRSMGKGYHNLEVPVLFEHAIRKNEGSISSRGALVVKTGQYTGRSANDKFIIRDSTTENVVWWGKQNRAGSPEQFARIKTKMQNYLKTREIYIQDCYAGADPEYRLPIRVITEKAWHSIFARNMFLFDEKVDQNFTPEFTVIACPGFNASPSEDGTRSEVCILINFSERLILIGGTSYGGEIKKSIFTVMNFLLPQRGVMSMHCSANRGQKGDTAVFFGLSGTGKTTLSAEADRALIGDDEHGWSDRGVFNFEGGCYAKVIKLSSEAEPEIYSAVHRFGALLENVVMNENSRQIDLNDGSITENTRGAYPISFLPNIVDKGVGDHPKNIIMLTADAFGILPPIARLSADQAMYHFVSGYTAKVAGTERGVNEPSATFSTCFGAPFMALHPGVYAKLLGERIEHSKANCWLVNTGWSGGPYGIGARMKIAYSRAVIRAALSGGLESVSYQKDSVFGLSIPTACANVPSEILNPRNTWKNPSAYDEKAKELALLFKKNFEEYSGHMDSSIKAAGPA